MGLMSTFSGYFGMLIEYYINFTKDFVHVEKLWNTFDDLIEIPGYKTGEKFSLIHGNFEFRNTSFSYNENPSVLKNFTLKIS